MTPLEHETILNTLHDAQLQIQYLHEKFQPTGSGETVLARLRAAINIMEKQPQ